MKLSINQAAFSSGPLSVPRRFARAVRVVWHILRGLLIMRLAFPRMTPESRRATITRWSRRLLHILGARVRLKGAPPAAGGAMLIINHTSWLDVYAVLATVHVRFVAKSEIRSWPLIGALVAGAGTLFMERGRSRQARRTNDLIAAAILEGETVAVFPEGTTSVGDVLLPFHAALLQPAIDAGTVVQPLALRYLDHDGAPTRCTEYVGEITLVESFWRIVGQRVLIIELNLMEPIAAAGRDRRDLARHCEQAIAAALGVATPTRKERRTVPDPPGAAR
jgi:1-acyl-sn-glycerol-3-phosphate acyltransferase